MSERGDMDDRLDLDLDRYQRSSPASRRTQATTAWIRMRPVMAKKGRGKPNYVTIVMPPVTERRLRKMLGKRVYCLAHEGDDSGGDGSD